MQFESNIREIIENECDDYYLGTTDLSICKDPMINKYKLLFDEYPQAISIGITLPQNSQLLKNDIYSNYSESYCKLKSISVNLCSFLEQEGYNTVVLPKSEKVNDEKFISIHKLVAAQADLGKIDENGFFITNDIDSKVNLGTVLTDASLI